MGRLCPAGHTDIGNRELEECSTEQTGMARASEEGQSPHRAVVPLMIIMRCFTREMHVTRAIFFEGPIDGESRTTERIRCIAQCLQYAHRLRHIALDNSERVISP